MGCSGLTEKRSLKSSGDRSKWRPLDRRHKLGRNARDEAVVTESVYRLRANRVCCHCSKFSLPNISSCICAVRCALTSSR
jgi:hypothetical protein